jgi:hypothetical protein
MSAGKLNAAIAATPSSGRRTEQMVDMFRPRSDTIPMTIDVTQEPMTSLGAYARVPMS